MPFAWPSGFARVPDEEWTRAPVDTLAAKYDRVDAHGWYANLDPTVDEIASVLREGDVLADYSGGTGILIGRLLAALGPRGVGVVNVDSSPKFLRLSLEKFRDDARVAFRLIRYRKEERRLDYVDEVLGPLAAQGVDALVSANAVHLYADLDATVRAWARVVRPGGRVHVQSGNVRTTGTHGWVIDDTVRAVAAAAQDLVAEDARWERWRGVLGDAPRMAQYARHLDRIFPPVRPLEHYVGALERAGFRLREARTRAVVADVDEWLQFLSVYHDGILPWVGGSEKVDGTPPSPEAVQDRQTLLREAARRVFGGRDAFDATWTYVSAERTPESGRA